MSEQVLSIP